MDRKVEVALDTLLFLREKIKKYDISDSVVQRALRAYRRMKNALQKVNEDDYDNMVVVSDKVRFWSKVWSMRLGDPNTTSDEETDEDEEMKSNCDTTDNEGVYQEDDE